MPEPEPDAIMCPRRAEIPATFQFPDQFPGPDTPVDDRCPFCGSLTAEAFMARARAGVTLGPTDKDYKVYVGDEPPDKFYFQHLDEGQRREFVELLNAKRLSFGYPGRFSRLPFFVRTEPKGPRRG